MDTFRRFYQASLMGFTILANPFLLFCGWLWGYNHLAFSYTIGLVISLAMVGFGLQEILNPNDLLVKYRAWQFCRSPWERAWKSGLMQFWRLFGVVVYGWEQLGLLGLMIFSLLWGAGVGIYTAVKYRHYSFS
jgi:hypothetical protein